MSIIILTKTLEAIRLLGCFRQPKGVYMSKVILNNKKASVFSTPLNLKVREGWDG